MREKIAQRFSKALVTIRDGYNAKFKKLPYSNLKLASAEQYVDDICVYIDKKSEDIERDFLFSCLGALDAIKEEGDFEKIACFAHAIHRIPFIFSGEEKWDRSFKNRYIFPFCQTYGNEWFSEILEMKIPKKSFVSENKSKKKSFSQASGRSIYRYNEVNAVSLPGYFCLRLLIAMILLPFLFGMTMYVHFSDYTESDRGERYEITVTSYEYENTDEYDYFYISCEEFPEQFEITRFFEFSNSPEKLIELCESGATLIAYVEYRTPKNYDNYYEIIHLEDRNGTVFRSYEQSNGMDRYNLIFLVIVTLVILVPSLILFILMLIVALNPRKFVSHPRFVKFCFPNYSLKL